MSQTGPGASSSSSYRESLPWHAWLIRRKLAELAERIDSKNTLLLDKLLQKGVFTRSEYRHIKVCQYSITALFNVHLYSIFHLIKCLHLMNYKVFSNQIFALMPCYKSIFVFDDSTELKSI